MKKRTDEKQKQINAAENFISTVSTAILAFYAINILLTTDSTIVRSVLGFAFAYATLNLAFWAWRCVIKPVAIAITANA